MNLKIFQWRSLQTRVTVFTLLIFLIGIWALAFYAGRMLRQDMQRLLGEQQFSTVSFVAGEVDRALAERLNALEKIAGVIPPAMFGDSASLQAYLAQFQVLHAQFNGGVVVLGADGVAIAEAPFAAERIGVNYMDVETVAAALKTGKSAISRPLLGKKLQAPIFSMTMPVRDAQGAVIGALAGVTNLALPNFLDQITENRYGTSGYYLLVDPQGRMIITGTGKRRVMQSLAAPGTNPLVDRHVAGYDETGVTVDSLGVEVLVSARRIPVANWYIVAALPTDEAFAPIHDMQRRMLLTTILLTLLAGSLTWWMLRRQLSPMLSAVKTLAALTETEQHPQPLPISRQDEIGDLIGGFNRLLATLGQRESALKESELRFRNFFEKNSSVMLLVEPATGAIVDANAAAATYYGYSPTQLVGMFTSDINTLTPERIAEERRNALREARNFFMFAHRLASGEVRDVEVHSTPIETAGRPLLFSIVHDVTVRKEAEGQLRIAAVAFESREGMMVAGANGVIQRVNKAFTEITGYPAEEAVGQTLQLLHSGRHSAEFYRDMWETINRTGSWQGEVWDRRKSGELYPKWLTISAVKDDQGLVSHYVGTHSDMSERKEAEARIETLAFFDQLTNLPNRTLLLDRLKQAMTLSGRSDSYGALLFIDLDNFQTLNNTLGHDVGDLLLKQVAQRLNQCVREGDSVARLGGDEFVVILTSLGTSEVDAATASETVAEKILATLKSTYQLGSIAHHGTASIGISLFRGNLASVDDLMKQADLAMYKSKAAGRNTFCFFDPAMEVTLKAHAALEGDLRLALREQQFLLHYQAQVTGDNRLTGAEALVRWQHPQRGMVSPGEFIPLAEDTSLILPLGRWVLETACRQLALWAVRPAMAHLTLAVNVSAHQFRQPDFVAQVLEILESTGANPLRLKLELTESLLVHDVEEIIEKMFSLKAKGVGFSLDDFGTGYSSLSYLKRLPLDQLKIDQSFVRDVLIDPNDAAIARTIVALAQSLGLGVIAEGVETAAQRDFLAGASCHAYQGYFFSRPLPVDDFEKFAQSSGH